MVRVGLRAADRASTAASRAWPAAFLAARIASAGGLEAASRAARAALAAALRARAAVRGSVYISRVALAASWVAQRAFAKRSLRASLGYNVTYNASPATTSIAATGANSIDRACVFFDTQYPSIIRAHNLCPSTMVMDPDHDAEGIEFFQVATSIGTFKFAQSAVAVVPALLEDLAASRKRAKLEMDAASRRGDDWAAQMFNAKQLAYKITMNSVYGFFGATRGMLPCVPLAASVTAVGRDMIKMTKEYVETTYPGSKVVYGDTDSVMVLLDMGASRHDLRAHHEAATRIADEVTALLKPPNQLEFEKMYYPYLLFNKKRYAGEEKKCGIEGMLAAVFVAAVLMDAIFRVGALKSLLHGVVGAWCSVTGRTQFERFDCTNRIYYSTGLWTAVAIMTGLAAGHVTLTALRAPQA